MSILSFIASDYYLYLKEFDDFSILEDLFEKFISKLVKFHESYTPIYNFFVTGKVEKAPLFANSRKFSNFVKINIGILYEQWGLSENIIKMFTASEKKRENIAEYILYMWQIENLIRAYNLDIDKIDSEIISKYTNLSEEQKKDLHDWYESLIDMMRREGVEKSGHLQLNKNTIIALDDLHRQLLADQKFAKYSAEFYKTLPYIVELRAKAGEEKSGEIETCLNALYGIMMLRMQGKEISKETMEAIAQISKFLGMLAGYYKKDFNNELFDNNKD